MMYFAVGFVVATLPRFCLLSLDADSYVFNNLGIHAIRSGSGLVGNVGQKLIAMPGAGLFGSPVNGHQLVLLYMAGLALMLKTRSGHVSLAFQLTAVLTFISLLPTPAYLQYFCVVIPFLIVGVVCAVHDLLSAMKRERIRLFTIPVLAALAIYLVAPINDYKEFVITGDYLGVPGEGAANWNPVMVRAVSRSINELAAPGEQVMSFWPGYVFDTHAAPFPGFENDTGLPHSALLVAGQRSKYHIVCRSQIEAQIGTRRPRIVVLGNQEYWHQPKQPYMEALVHSGYHWVRLIENTSIYILGPSRAVLN